MQIKTQRFIDAFFGKIVCRVLDVFSLFRRRKETGKKPAKICVILLSEMGSLSLTWPMFQRLRERHPGADFFLVTLERNREIVVLMNLVPEKNIVTVDDASFVRFARESMKMLINLRRNRIDTVIDCELFSRISSIYAFLSGAEIRVAFHPHTQEGLFRGHHINRPVLYNPYLHMSRQFLNLALSLESNTVPKNKHIIDPRQLSMPQYKVPESDRKESIQRINTLHPDLLKKPLVLLNPGGGLLPIRAWPIGHYCKVAAHLAESGFSVAVTGMPEDRGLAEKITSYCGSDACVDMTGFTKNIKELLTLFTLSEVLITNDGGPGHFAGLTSTPSIILFGPETPVLYGALNPSAVNMKSDCACSPCLTAYNHRNSPCDGDNLCLQSITPSEVLEKAYEFL